MDFKYDIFRAAADGNWIWVEAAVSHDAGVTRAQHLAVSAPGEYMIFCQKTTERVVVNQSTSSRAAKAGEQHADSA